MKQALPPSKVKRPHEPKQKKRRAHGRRSVGTIVVATMAAVVVAAFSVPMIGAGRQRICVQRIWQLGGYVERVSDDRLHKPPAWYRTLLGDDFMNPVTCVRLTQTDVSDGDLSQLKRLTQLKFLDLTDTSITDEGVHALPCFRHLQVLSLTNTRVSDAGLSSLLDCSVLRFLDLEETGITDAGLEVLLGLRNLRWLDLSGTQVTDVGVRKLALCPNLQTLVLDGCNVSPEAIADLIAARPQLEIHVATDCRPFWNIESEL